MRHLSSTLGFAVCLALILLIEDDFSSPADLLRMGPIDYVFWFLWAGVLWLIGAGIFRGLRVLRDRVA